MQVKGIDDKRIKMQLIFSTLHLNLINSNGANLLFELSHSFGYTFFIYVLFSKGWSDNKCIDIYILLLISTVELICM